MSFVLRLFLLSLVLSLSFAHPYTAQVQSSAETAARAAINDLATALQNATSEQEQETLLAQHKDFTNSALLAALKDLMLSFQGLDGGVDTSTKRCSWKIQENLKQPYW